MANIAIKTVSEQTVIIPFLSGATTNQTSPVFELGSQDNTCQSIITGTGAVSATIQWYGNNQNSTSNGILLTTHLLNGTTTDQAGSWVPANWPYMYAVISNISGTGAAVTLLAGA